MAHKTGFTAKTLNALLIAAGFEDVVLQRSGFDLWARATSRPDGCAVRAPASDELAFHPSEFPGPVRPRRPPSGRGRATLSLHHAAARSAQIDGVRKIVYAPRRTRVAGAPVCAGFRRPRSKTGWPWRTFARPRSARDSRPTSSSAITAGARSFTSRMCGRGTPLLGYFEFFYRAIGQRPRFRPGISAVERTTACASVRAMRSTCWASKRPIGARRPTEWQRSQYPAAIGRTISVIHEGIDTERGEAGSRARLWLSGGAACRSATR